MNSLPVKKRVFVGILDPKQFNSAVTLTSRLSGTGCRTVRRWQSLRFAVSALFLHHNLPVYAFQQSELLTLEVMACVSCLRR